MALEGATEPLRSARFDLSIEGSSMRKSVAMHCAVLALTVTPFGCGSSPSAGGMGGGAGKEGKAGSSGGNTPTSVSPEGGGSHAGGAAGHTSTGGSAGGGTGGGGSAGDGTGG